MSKRLPPDLAGWLYDAYGVCLTERQRDVFELVYQEDWSLAEAAAYLGISRAAVADLLARGAKQLSDLEDKLGAVAEKTRRRPVVEALGVQIRALSPGPEQCRLEATWRQLAKQEGLTERV